eukprot:700640-Rhodomonas_salina.2
MSAQAPKTLEKPPLPSGHAKHRKEEEASEIFLPGDGNGDQIRRGAHTPEEQGRESSLLCCTGVEFSDPLRFSPSTQSKRKVFSKKHSKCEHSFVVL